MLDNAPYTFSFALVPGFLMAGFKVRCTYWAEDRYCAVDKEGDLVLYENRRRVCLCTFNLDEVASFSEWELVDANIC